jgi:hypothetical protein
LQFSRLPLDSPDGDVWERIVTFQRCHRLCGNAHENGNTYRGSIASSGIGIKGGIKGVVVDIRAKIIDHGPFDFRRSGLRVFSGRMCKAG